MFVKYVFSNCLCCFRLFSSFCCKHTPTDETRLLYFIILSFSMLNSVYFDLDNCILCYNCNKCRWLKYQNMIKLNVCFATHLYPSTLPDIFAAWSKLFFSMISLSSWLSMPFFFAFEVAASFSFRSFFLFSSCFWQSRKAWSISSSVELSWTHR